MMHICTITSKYQITLPSEIRQKEGLRIGDKVIFLYNEHGDIIVRPLRKPSATELAGALHQDGIEYIPFKEARRIAQEEFAKKFFEEGRDEE